MISNKQKGKKRKRLVLRELVFGQPEKKEPKQSTEITRNARTPGSKNEQ
jgi:hypothetical protein